MGRPSRAVPRAGVDEVLLSMTGVFNACGPRAALRDATAVLAAVAATADRAALAAG